MEKKQIRRAVVLALIVVLAAGIAVILYAARKNFRAGSRIEKAPVVAEEKKEESAATISQGKVGNARPANAIKTNDDIKRVYGRVETVYLRDGRSFTGAVTGSTAQEYSIVTVDGMKKVPMRMVKMREIIR